MAFCTQCGAGIVGAFCTQCGARAAQGAAAPGSAPPSAPAGRRTSPIVWVLIVVLGICAVGVIGVVGTGAFVLHKMRQAGVDPELWSSNPGLAVGKVMAAVNPNLEVVRTDHDSGRVTLRDRRNGKQFSINIDAARRGQFSLRADDDNRSGSVEFGGDAKIPAWVPTYPGSRPEQIFSAKGESEGGAGEAGSFTFQTGDRPSKVVSFYEGQGREMGLDVRVTDAAGALTLVVGHEDRERFLKVVAAGGSDETKVTVTYGRKL
jgi:hypothetical protein